MKKKKILTQYLRLAGIPVPVLVMFLFISCKNEKAKTIEETSYPVEIVTVNRTERTKQIRYFGIVSSQITNYSFSMPGKIEFVYVKKNEFVSKGTRLMQLETTGLKLALDAAKSQLGQAKSAFEEADIYYQNLEKAFKSGGISKSDLNKALLDKEVKEKDFQQATINKQAKQDDLDHASLYAIADGIVSDIVPEIGEIVDAGAETIIVQGTGFFAETALSQKDIDKINIGTKAVIRLRDKETTGKVSYISSLPDFQTFRHTVKVEFTSKQSALKTSIGQTVDIYFTGENVSGYWIPLAYVFNNGEDFVNVIENNRLRKKRVFIVDFSGDKVRVEGLKENEKLITKGAVNIKEGYKVRVLN